MDKDLKIIYSVWAFVIVAVMLFPFILASPQGPNSPGTMADDNSIGTQTWSNPDYAKVLDSSYATVNLNAVSQAPQDYSVRLVKGGIITGNDLASNSSLPSSKVDINYGGADNLWGTTWTPAQINASDFGFVFAVYGHDYDKLSHYLKATNFGFTLPEDSTVTGIKVTVTAYQNVSTADDVFVDHMKITVYYTTCTCPGLNNNWQINMADHCVISTNCDLGTGTLSFTGSGNATCDARIDTTNMGDPGANGILYINNDCVITVD